MIYIFCGLINGKPVQEAKATVSKDGTIKWDDEVRGKKIEESLTSHDFITPDKQFRPIDIHSYEDWKRVSKVIQGSYFWCEAYYENAEEANER
jgi:hypothetical protein